jgi:hypothetical protein
LTTDPERGADAVASGDRLEMPSPPAKRNFPNPFYVLLLAASTLFVVTIFVYLLSPVLREQAARGALPRNAGEPVPSPADWIDRHAPLALGVEFVVMLIAGLLAMATDRWFAPKAARESASDG